MEKSKFIFCILFLSILGINRPGWGADETTSLESSGAITLTLAQTEALALEGNPLIQAADKRVDEASRQKLQTLSPADPVFMIERYGESASPLNVDGPGTEMWMVSEDLGFPGEGFAQVDVDNAQTQKAKAMAENTRRKILRQAREAFWEFYYRQEVYGLLQNSLKEWKTLNGILKSGALSGQWLSMKMVRSQLEVAQAINDFFTASQALETSRLDFNQLFNFPEGTTYCLAKAPILSPLSGTESDYIHQVLQNPEVQAAEGEVNQAGAQAHVAALTHLPNFNLRVMGMRNPDGEGFSGYGIRLGVSFPLFFPLKQTQATAQADDEVVVARDELTDIRNHAIQMTEQSYVQAQSAWRLWQLYHQGGLLEQTHRAWVATQAAYRHQQLPLWELIDSYQTYLQTLKSYYQAKADYGEALAQLDYQVGDWKLNQDSRTEQP